jgi:hypothetical protein
MARCGKGVKTTAFDAVSNATEAVRCRQLSEAARAAIDAYA